MSELLPDITTILPFGPSLTPLIYSSFLSDANLGQLLKNRGVYQSSNDKDIAVGIIKNMILSPDEFNSLREQQKTKEDKTKNLGEDISFISKDTLFNITKDDHFTVNNILEGEQGNIQIEGVSSISFVDNNHSYYEYNLIREDISKDWANSKSKHSGRVDIIKKADSISINSEYTSVETKKVNEKIKSRIKKLLEKATSDGKLEISKITFGSFSNENRINFLFSFLENMQPFSLHKILNISFGPDPRKEQADMAKWMENRVKNLSVFGEKLDRIEYFADKKYHEGLLIENIDAQFFFTIDTVKYIAKISYGFPAYFKTEIPDTEFEFSILEIADSDSNKKSNNGLRRAIDEVFSAFKMKKFYELKNMN